MIRERNHTGWLDEWGNDLDVDDDGPRFDVLDDDLARLAAWHRRDLHAAFDFLGAVVEARFATIRAGLNMTREVVA